MAKQFLANRSGQTPTLDEVPNETIKIYNTEAEADADLTNLEENEIFATDEDNNPASGNQYPVDTVQDGNMHSVTSNAVAEMFNNLGITKVTYGSVHLDTGTSKTININTRLATLRHISISPSSNAGYYPTWYITRSYETNPTVQITYTNSGSNTYLNWMAFGE